MPVLFNSDSWRHFVAVVGLIAAIANLCMCEIIKIPLVDYKVVYDKQPLYTYLNVSEHPGELCNRRCDGGPARICYFQFTLEHYQAMGVACGKCAEGVLEDCNNVQCIAGDGVEKGVMSINRQIPGPALQVCQGDLIVVDVHNRAHGTAAVMHWHGLHMVETPYMDGVPFLTQCPIAFSNVFRYQFRAAESGTQFYHSHSGHHKANGQFGVLIIRRPSEPFSYLYDFDMPAHYIIINDWLHVYAEQLVPGLPSSELLPDSVLINGRGLFTNPKTGQQTRVPPTVYTVARGFRYRFRLINAGNHACPFQLQIQHHYLTIIASDSMNLFPYVTETLVINSGERYDFVVHANRTAGDFLIRVRGMGICITNRIESFAVLRYASNARPDNLQPPPYPKYEDVFTSANTLNHPNATCVSKGIEHCITELSAVDESAELQRAEPDHKFVLGFQNYPVPNGEIFRVGRYDHFTNLASNVTVVGSINNISLLFPDYPLLIQPERLEETRFCDENNLPPECADYTVCSCIHRLKVRLNSMVELVLVDETAGTNLISHPFHLHGYRFIVVGMGRDPSGVRMTTRRLKSMKRREQVHTRSIFKDTVSIPSQGYVIIRFKATNPGFWLMHCHYDWHFTNGMGLILQVGETWQMVPPPNHFPQCGNYLPPVTQKTSLFSDVRKTIRHYRKAA